MKGKQIIFSKGSNQRFWRSRSSHHEFFLGDGAEGFGGFVEFGCCLCSFSIKGNSELVSWQQRSEFQVSYHWWCIWERLCWWAPKECKKSNLRHVLPTALTILFIGKESNSILWVSDRNSVSWEHFQVLKNFMSRMVAFLEYLQLTFLLSSEEYATRLAKEIKAKYGLTSLVCDPKEWVSVNILGIMLLIIIV